MFNKKIMSVPSNEVRPVAPDEQLAADLLEIGAGDIAYDSLAPPDEAIQREHDAFTASSGTYNPDLRPREVDQEQLTSWEEWLLAQKGDLPDDPTLQQAYRWKINESIAFIRMSRAAIPDAEDHNDQRRFEAYNSFVYGHPDPEVFGAVADWYVAAAEKALNSDRPEVRQAAETVLAELGGSRGDRSLLIPDQAVLQAVKDEHYREDGYFDKLLRAIELPEGTVTAENGDPLMRKMLGNLGCRHTVEDGPEWEATHNEYRRPADYSMSPQEFLEFNGHEFSHLVETANGDQSPVRIMKVGLDRYEQGNEGRGVIREQLINEDVHDFLDSYRWHEILTRHLTVALGSGLSGHGADFARTHTAMQAVYRLYEYTHSPADDVDTATARADDLAWDMLVSAYKGTDGSGEGGVYRRPMVYLEGAVAIWREAAKHPGTVSMGDLGKFDVSNPRHISTLQRLGVLPETAV